VSDRVAGDAEINDAATRDKRSRRGISPDEHDLLDCGARSGEAHDRRHSNPTV
jgi:hypothetical protein